MAARKISARLVRSFAVQVCPYATTSKPYLSPCWRSLSPVLCSRDPDTLSTGTTVVLGAWWRTCQSYLVANLAANLAFALGLDTVIL